MVEDAETVKVNSADGISVTVEVKGGLFMSTRRILVRALLALLIVGILIGGGYALYRIGYAHGVQDSVQIEFGKRFDHGFPRGVERDFWSRGGRFGFSPLRAIPGLLFTLAILGLIVVGAVSLIKMILPRRGESGGHPAANEPPPTTS